MVPFSTDEKKGELNRVPHSKAKEKQFSFLYNIKIQTETSISAVEGDNIYNVNLRCIGEMTKGNDVVISLCLRNPRVTDGF